MEGSERKPRYHSILQHLFSQGEERPAGGSLTAMRREVLRFCGMALSCQSPGMVSEKAVPFSQRPCAHCRCQTVLTPLTPTYTHKHLDTLASRTSLGPLFSLTGPLPCFTECYIKSQGQPELEKGVFYPHISGPYNLHAGPAFPSYKTSSWCLSFFLSTMGSNTCSQGLAG